MKILNRRMVNELFGGVVGWIWIIGSIISVYLLIKVIFFDGSWFPFLVVFGISGVCKILTRVSYQEENYLRGLEGFKERMERRFMDKKED